MKTHTHPTLTTLVCEDATGEVLWTVFLTLEEYRRYIRKWAELGDPREALEASMRE
jgi:hypothetical protein